MRILYVDDDALAVRAVTRELRVMLDDDSKVVGVTSPREAIDLLRAETWDVVLSDFAMPEMDGVELLAEVEKLAPQARRLMLTGSPDESKIGPALASGLIELMFAKPVSGGVLR